MWLDHPTGRFPPHSIIVTPHIAISLRITDLLDSSHLAVLNFLASHNCLPR